MTKNGSRQRSPVGVALTPAEQEEVRALLGRRGAQRTGFELGVSAPAAIRASSGLRVLPGTAALVRAGLQRIREARDSLGGGLALRKGGVP